jgi:hypothetical protein
MKELERFRQLLPQIVRVKPLVSDDEVVCWEAYDESGAMLGYAFAADVPETAPDIPGMEEMDKYQVTGIVEPKEYRIISLDISLHPEGPEEPWDIRITEPDFERQYIGLTVEEIDLSPDGKIDAISDATFSSTWLTDAIRGKVRAMIEKTRT